MSNSHTMPSLSPQEITLAYRRLHRTLLRAVQYSKPGRFVVRDRIRTAFRSSSHVDYDAKRFERTLEFFDGAARVHSLEHKIVKNLVHVWWERGKLAGVRLYVS